MYCLPVVPSCHVNAVQAPSAAQAASHGAYASNSPTMATLTLSGLAAYTFVAPCVTCSVTAPGARTS